MLAAGCEQLKAPKRLKDLESRVDELTATVTAMNGGKPGAAPRRSQASKPTDEHAGSDDAPDGDGHGSAEPHGDAEGHGAGSDEAKGSDAHAGSDEASADKHGAEEPAADKHGAEEPAADKHAGSADDHAGSGDHAGSDAAAPDAGEEKLSKSDRALQDIAKLMASTKRKVVEESEAAADPAHGDKPAADPERGGKHAADKPGPGDKPAPGDKAAKKADEHPAPHWGYDAKLGPPLWGSLDPAWRTCEQGKAQSPVDIEPRAGNASPITFHYEPTQATIIDNGHTLQVNFAPGNSIEIGDSTYQLLQVHFHTPSEHTIAGEHFPLEAHLVHKTASGKLAVVGVLFDSGAPAKLLGGLFSAWPRKVGVEAKLGKIDPSTLLPDTRTVYRYGGSLTTPPCTEGVLWNVMRRTLTDSAGHLDAFRQHYRINAREVRPLNGRKVD